MRLTLVLIGLNVFVFLLQATLSGFTDVFALTPELAFQGAWWQFFTYMFLHGGPTHILLNMFMLFIFGEVMEHALGKVRFIALYVVSGLGSALAYILLTGFSNIPFIGTTMLGASGAVFGVMAAYGLMFPKNKIYIGMLIPLPAFTVVILLAVTEFVLGIFGLEQGIANFGHFGGIITGVLMTYYWKRFSRPKTIDERRNFEFFWE